ncbi:MBL fold metallo-hydrolase [Streptomyces sp. SID13726]|uniref:MBL fold metallo-hydrolase n=1 Tax=Streptomyces sp. SID13726 TaxID=2706058 RepID=UPI0013B955A4|nr:MBL fold metallo-hydrolase [Streptomyces sp. SID13726]NEB04176.1 MBL fold metallo-hydrolase [Streptomyces sp. SID13726]
MRGTVTIIDKGNVRVHSYMAPDTALNVTTQLIETPSRLIAVDGQVTVADADEVVEYANGLGKPLDRLIITHAHPDHYQGAHRFNAPIHALAVTRDEMAARGDLKDPTGIPVPAAETAPTDLITPGTEVIDGVPFVFEAVSGGETTDQLLIRLPEHGVLVAQDLIYHHTHVFVGNNDIARWQDILQELVDPAYDTVLPGHGLPAGQAVFAEMAEYLEAARELLGDDGEAYKQAIIERFPSYGSPFVIDIGNYYLFGTPF